LGLTVRIERIVVHGTPPAGKLGPSVERALTAEAWVSVGENRQATRVRVPMVASEDRDGWSRALASAILRAVAEETR